MSGLPTELPPLRDWQAEALLAWVRAGRRGIIAAATGTGKTRIALEAIAENPDSVSIVVVPTIALQQQWVREISLQLKLSPTQIGTIGGDGPSFRTGHRIVVAVLASAQAKLEALTELWKQLKRPVLLIVDECHWAGTQSAIRGIWAAQYESVLGLSATPERKDGGHDEVLIPLLGAVVYEYPVRKALDDKVLAPLYVNNIAVPLSQLEISEYARLTLLIQSLTSSLDPSTHKQVARLSDERNQLLRGINGRHLALAALLESSIFSERRTLVFHETIESARGTVEVLNRRNLRYAVEHSMLPSAERTNSLRQFAAGAADFLVTVRALDEGIDVPEADTAIIVSGRQSARQRLQRAGRILRPSGKDSWLITLIGSGTQEEAGVVSRDCLLFGHRRVHFFGSVDSFLAKSV